MKLIVLVAVPYTTLAASWASLFQSTQLEAVSTVDLNGCIANAEPFMTKEFTKHKAIERAMDHCALSKKVDDKNFVCPHYREVLNAAFRREPTDRLYSAESFCSVAEVYVHQLKSAAKVPNMGKGEGFKFKMSKAVRLFAHDEAAVFGPKEMDADQVCEMYEEFVEDSHIDVEAYMHVVHGKENHPVPVPMNADRALKSAKMKHEAKMHGIRDQSGDPVKSSASTHMPMALIAMLFGFSRM